MGCPIDYSAEIADAICDELACGESLAAICRRDDMPDRRTIQRWQTKDASLAARIARARDLGQDFIIDECREIADNAGEDTVQVARLRIWQRQWEASKRAQKRFGDKIRVEDDRPSDRLQELLAAMQKGPVPRGQVNEAANDGE